MKKSLFASMSLIVALPAFAGNGGVSGGDPRVVEFLSVADRVCSTMSQSPDLKRYAKSCKVELVDLWKSVNDPARKPRVSFVAGDVLDSHGTPKDVVTDLKARKIVGSIDRWSKSDSSERAMTVAMEMSLLIGIPERYHVAQHLNHVSAVTPRITIAPIPSGYKENSAVLRVEGRQGPYQEASFTLVPVGAEYLYVPKEHPGTFSAQVKKFTLSLNEDHHVDEGAYIAVYSGTVSEPFTLRKGKSAVLHLSELSIPKDGARTRRVEIDWDLTTPEQQRDFLTKLWTGTLTDQFMPNDMARKELGLLEECKSSSEHADSINCRSVLAWDQFRAHGSDPLVRNGLVRFTQDGEVSLFRGRGVFFCSEKMLLAQPQAGSCGTPGRPCDFTSAVCKMSEPKAWEVAFSAGDFISVFPGVYQLKYHNFDGSVDVVRGVTVN